MKAKKNKKDKKKGKKPTEKENEWLVIDNQLYFKQQEAIKLL